jgi:hypothetical protein
MVNTDAFALRRSGQSEFLFAPVGTEANGMTMSVVSLMAGHGSDPWHGSGRLAKLPKPEATERMPTSVGPEQSARTIAARLVALLPKPAENLGKSSSASAYGQKPDQLAGLASCWP